jgi:hypothetical protein
MIKAKTVIPDQYWILRNDVSKVGNIEAKSGEYTVSINGKVQKFQNLATLVKQVDVEFDETQPVVKPIVPTNLVHGFPTDGVPHNAIFDLKHQLPLWTRDERSRSWLTAGWYRIRQHRDWQIVFCPKLILLLRYEYQGPFESLEKARSR